MDNILTGFGHKPNGFSVVKNCDEEFTGNAKLGDLFMVKRGSSSEGSGLGYYHAGVYCSEEEKEIIHFTFLPAQSSFLSSMESTNPSSGQGTVNKVSVKVFCKENKFAVYRKDGGIPPTFKADVRDAMEKTPDYDLSKYNCIHFALELLKVDSESIGDYITWLKTFISNKPTNTEMEPMMC